jgi:hypothetical protein
MINRKKLALVAALLAPSATLASANDGFDVNIYRPAPPASTLQAYAQSPAPGVLRNKKSAVPTFTPEEKRMFERAVGAVD